MKYPRELEDKVKEIEAIIAKWPVEKTLQEVMEWILQFETEDFDLAIRILRQMNVIGQKDFEGALKIAFSKLMRHGQESGANISNTNTIYCPIGTAGKSGAMVAYHFRSVNNLASSHFLDEETLKLLQAGKIKNLVLVDDIIATGDQSKETVAKIKPIAAAAGINKVYLLSIVGFKEGIKAVQETGQVDVFSAFEYDEIDTIKSIDCSFFDGMPYCDRKQAIQKISKKYKGQGYKGFGGFVTFYYNTPNCTLYSVSMDTDGWIPLFFRYKDLKGVEAPELEQLTKELGEAKLSQEKMDECSIYTEEKIIELFMTELAAKHDNFGFKSLRIMSIGAIRSKNVLDKYRKMTSKSIFVTDDEPNDKKASRSVMNEKDVIMMGNVMKYFDIMDVLKLPLCSSLIGENPVVLVEPKLLYQEWETKLLKRVSPTMRVEVMKELVNNCIINSEVVKLIERIKKVYG
jgi:hypothetical protein